MSTRALVGVVQEDGGIKYRKVRSDGYLEGTGVDLLENFSTPEGIKNFYSFDESCEDSPYFLYGIYTVDSEKDFITAAPFYDYQYLYKDGDWYYGDWFYDDGCVRSIETGEIVRRVRDPSLSYGEKGWRLLKDQFIITERIVRDYKLIPEEEDD